MIILTSSSALANSDNWTYSEKVNHFEKSVFLDSMYDDATENSGFAVSCDKGGENEIFAKFVTLKDENYLLFSDLGFATFDFVIDDILDTSISGFYTYESDQKVFVGMSNKLPKNLLNAMASPLSSNKQLHIRMTVNGMHLKALKKALANDESLNTDDAVIEWIKDNAMTQGISHHFEKHIDLNGFNKHIESYNGCAVSG